MRILDQSNILKDSPERLLEILEAVKEKTKDVLNSSGRNHYRNALKSLDVPENLSGNLNLLIETPKTYAKIFVF